MANRGREIREPLKGSRVLDGAAAADFADRDVVQTGAKKDKVGRVRSLDSVEIDEKGWDESSELRLGS